MHRAPAKHIFPGPLPSIDGGGSQDMFKNVTEEKGLIYFHRKLFC